AAAAAHPRRSGRQRHRQTRSVEGGQRPRARRAPLRTRRLFVTRREDLGGDRGGDFAAGGFGFDQQHADRQLRLFDRGEGGEPGVLAVLGGSFFAFDFFDRFFAFFAFDDLAEFGGAGLARDLAGGDRARRAGPFVDDADHQFGQLVGGLLR